MIPLTGKSPNTFIKEYRLNRALQLLDSQVLNISEIAFETGFNSPAYFTRAFKKQFGLLPTNFTRGSKTS
jgi:AraC-like DNA-binding protein